MESAINISREIHCLKGHTGAVFSVKFNANGEYCLSCGEDKKVYLWNPHKGILVNKYEGHNWEVLDVCCSKDNTQIASCGAGKKKKFKINFFFHSTLIDKQAIVWDVMTGKQLKKIRAHTSRVTCVSFNSLNSLLFTGSYDRYFFFYFQFFLFIIFFFIFFYF